MSESTGNSEVARLRRQITLALEAAERGLSGLAFGTARHDFITKRMEQMAECHEALTQLVGEEEATLIMIEALEEKTEQEVHHE